MTEREHTWEVTYRISLLAKNSAEFDSRLRTLMQSTFGDHAKFVRGRKIFLPTSDEPPGKHARDICVERGWSVGTLLRATISNGHVREVEVTGLGLHAVLIKRVDNVGVEMLFNPRGADWESYGFRDKDFE